MAYTPTVWATGDIITAENLNKMESGIESANNSLFVVKVLTIDTIGGTFTCDKTWEEIKNAYENGKSVVMRHMYNTTQTNSLYRFYKDVACKLSRETDELIELTFVAIEAKLTGTGADQYTLIINANAQEFHKYSI